MTSYKVKLQNEKFGVLVDETFVDSIQFKLFLKSIQGCLVTKTDFTIFNGVDFFIHIPYKNLCESIITTSTEEYTMAEHLINKSKIEKV
jgi:hypothetical protein